MQKLKVRKPAYRFPSSLPSTATVVLHSFAAVLLRKAAGLKKGSGEPNTNKVGKVNRAQLEEIATTKMPDLTAADMDAAVRTIAGTARSMGIDVEGVN